MTAPTGLPPVHRTEPAANPAGGGLYSAATLVDEPDPPRLSGGVLLESTNTGAHGRWSPGTDSEPADDKGGELRGLPERTFPATVVWASDDRRIVGVSEEDAELAARQTLRIAEPVQVEDFLAQLMLERIDATHETGADGADGLIEALAHVEATAGASGLPLTVHAPRHAAAHAASKGLVVRRSDRLETPVGNRWAFGAGYAALGEQLVATGPVTVYRSRIEPSVALQLADNSRMSLVERDIAVTWDGPLVAASISLGGA